MGGVLVVAIPLWIAGDIGPVPTPPTPATPTSEADLTRLEAQVCYAFDQGNHADAEAAARTLLARTEATYGPRSLQTAAALDLTVTETAFKTLAPGKELGHLAIHAFVLNSECQAADRDTRGHGRPTLDPVSMNPLQLPGLVFAGANHRDTIPLEQDDGILTAEEVVPLDLHGVQWAVLSAGDTGVGEVQSGEGVLGLRRAFQIAGVRTLVMSLWSLSDAATCQWMEALYNARFGDGLGAAMAVHTATKGVLDSRRRNGQPTHPYFWAGFVATGAWE